MADTLRPFVYWGQKIDDISLKVDLRKTLVEKVDLTEDRLEAVIEGVGAQGNNRYGFELDFYLPVNPEESKYRETDRGVEFSIKKKGAEVWPRLTEKQVKLPWLKIDFDRFTFEDEDEEEEDEEELQAKYMAEKIAQELKEEELQNPQLDVKKMYLFFYNLFQFVGFTFIVFSLSYHYFKSGPVVYCSRKFLFIMYLYVLWASKEKAFETVGTQLMVCQVVAILEVLHPLIGLVKTGVMTPFMQVAGRNLILFGLILQDIRLQDAPAVWYLFMTWSAVELIRYPFYMLSTIEYEISWITWLRYTAWIPLYPLGILFEATIVIMSIPLFEESNIFSLQLPNSANFAFYFPWFLHTYLLVLAFGGVKMMHHMYELRKKKLSKTAAFLKKMN